jgi:SOS-response transcriptional repressor LexA
MEKTTFGKRVLEALQIRSMKQIELSEKTGISRGAISSYISGRWVAKQDNVYLIAKALNVSEAWLMGYDVPMEKDSPAAIKQTRNLPFPPMSEYYDIPVGIAAGALEEIDGMQDIPKISIPDSFLGKYARNRDIVFMHVNGESMNKIIQNGATIAVLMNINLDTINNGDVVVAQNCHGEYTVKHFYDDEDNDRFILRPDSSDPSFTDMIFNYDNADEMKIFGKVVIYSVYL